MDLSGLSPVLSDVTLTIASDVTNPLNGELGAAAVYGPQKGADEAAVRLLDANLAHYADMLERATGRDVRSQPGSGAAGGTTAGLLAIADAFAGLHIRPGVDVVMELTDFDARLALRTWSSPARAASTSRRRSARRRWAWRDARPRPGKPCIAFGGGVTVVGAEALLRSVPWPSRSSRSR